MRFADTSFWVALFYARDAHHAEAREMWLANDEPIAVSNHVLGETWTFLRRRSGHAAAVEAVEAIRSSRRVQVLHCAPDTEEEAWRWLRRRPERAYSFVDASSFAVMRRKRVREALAFDGDFSAAGFVEVRPT
ncbi:MAG: PIN domain-containing protein [Actinobacteria bacterium]|nr:PIN domain-containing protein [Actinomycetota bacterium]